MSSMNLGWEWGSLSGRPRLVWHGYWRGPTEMDVLMILPVNTEQGSLSDNRKSPLITLGLGDGTADSEKTKVIPASQSWRSPAMQLLQGAK